jgi:predicted heme/steroid binding protein
MAKFSMIGYQRGARLLRFYVCHIRDLIDFIFRNLKPQSFRGGYYVAYISSFMLNTEQLPVITRAQLALRNGQDKPEVWVAYHGLIFDVTASRLWRSGKHYEHWAGQDLTNELKDAPHTEKVFDKFTPIGRLKN